MHQIESLYSSVSLNHFLILPQEILSLIIVGIDLDVVKNAAILMSVSTELRNHVKSSLKYVDRLTVHGIQMLELFVGIKHLDMSLNFRTSFSQRSKICSAFFSRNSTCLRGIWINLESLSISSHLYNELISSNTEHSRYFFIQDDCYSLGSVYPSDNDFMSNLRSLDICGKNTFGDYEIRINPAIFPSLEILVLNNCFLKNVHEFRSLKVLVLDMIVVGINMNLINMLNIEELRLNCVECVQGNSYESGQMLSIPTLRILEIKHGGKYVNMKILNNLNLTELRLLYIEWKYENGFNISSDLNIPTLRSLTLEGTYMNPGVLNKHNLTELRLLDILMYWDEFRLNIPTLRSLEIRNADEMDMNGFPNLEILKIFDSNISYFSRIRPILIDDEFRMKNLTRLDIALTGSYKIGLDINRLTFPRLRYLNLSGYACNTVIISEDMLDIDITECQPLDYSSTSDSSVEEQYCLTDNHTDLLYSSDSSE